MSMMLLAALTDDPLGIVLAIGVLVSASSAVVYFIGRSSKRVTSSKPVTPGEIMSASSTLARAQAAARERSIATASADGYRLTGVRPARSPREAPPEYPQRVDRSTPQVVRPEGQAAGQATKPADSDESDREAVTAQASAIAFHIAENDPQRMAEVIRTWIRQDRERAHGSR